MKYDNFSIDLKLDGQSEQISFANRKLEYLRKIDNIISIDIVFEDSFQNFIRALEDFADNCIKSAEVCVCEDMPVIELKFDSASKHFEYRYNFSKNMPEGWGSCALSLVEMLNGNTLFCKFADAALFDR